MYIWCQKCFDALTSGKMFGFHFQPVSMSAKKREKKNIRLEKNALPGHTLPIAVQANFPWYWFSAFSCVHKIWIIRYINHNKANHFRCVCITELKLNLFERFSSLFALFSPSVVGAGQKCVSVWKRTHTQTHWLTDWVEHLAFDSVSKGRYIDLGQFGHGPSSFFSFTAHLLNSILDEKKCRHSIQKYYTGSFHSLDPLSLILYRPVCLFCHGTWYKSFFWMWKNQHEKKWDREAKVCFKCVHLS